MYCSDFWWILLFICITLLIVCTVAKKWIALLIFFTVLLFPLYGSVAKKWIILLISFLTLLLFLSYVLF